MPNGLWINECKYMAMREDYEMSRKGTPPTKPTRKVKADVSKVMTKVNGRLSAGQEKRVPVLRSGAVGDWPTDVPVLIEVERVLGLFKHPEAGDAEGVMGYIMEMEFPVHGVNLTVKLYRDPRNVIITANGMEVYRGAGALPPVKPREPVEADTAPEEDDPVLVDDDDDEIVWE